MSNYPDSWTVNVGTPGTDFASVVPAGLSKTCIQLKNTAVATALSQEQGSAHFPGLYRCRTRFQADRRNIGDNVTISMYFPRLLAVPNTAAINGLVAAINTWQTNSAYYFADEACRGAYAKIAKAATAFNVIVDYVSVEKVPLFFDVYRSSNQTGLATGTTLVWNAEVDDYAAAHNTATGIFTVPAGMDGKWAFDASGEFSGLLAGNILALEIQVNGTTVAYEDHYVGAGSIVAGVHSGSISVAAGDQVKVLVNHNRGANLTMTGSALYSWFRGREVA